MEIISESTQVRIYNSRVEDFAASHDKLSASMFCTIFSFKLLNVVLHLGLVFFDPPRSAADPTLSKYTIDSYIEAYQAISYMNTKDSWLFVCTCTLLELGPLHTRLAELTNVNKKATVKVGVLTLDRGTKVKEWCTSAIGLVYIWKGCVFNDTFILLTYLFSGYQNCTNIVEDTFFGHTLSHTLANYSEGLYIGKDGNVVDQTELPLAFYHKLLHRHTLPGDWVLDICSGSGALTVIASSCFRNVVAVEASADRFHSICNRIRGIQDISPLSNEDLLEITKNNDYCEEEHIENFADYDKYSNGDYSKGEDFSKINDNEKDNHTSNSGCDADETRDMEPANQMEEERGGDEVSFTEQCDTSSL